jgi:polysaccharide export outer membrane protein
MLIPANIWSTVGRLLATRGLRMVVASLLLMQLGSGCATSSSDRPEVELEEVKFSFDTEQTPTDRFRHYLISPGDVLDIMYHIKSWEGQDEFRLSIDNQVDVKFPDMPELNEEAIIRPDGKISLPYLGEVDAAGKTVSELTSELKSSYAGILKKPELFVTVPDFRSAIREFKADLHSYGRGLSRLVTVRPDGLVAFPIIGDLMVSGKAFEDVKQEMNVRYAKVLPGLSVDLSLDSHSGSRIYVLGQVGTPGAYAIDRPTTVVEALALAGSPLRDAKLGNVVVMRRRAGKMVGMRVNARSALHLRKDSFFFYLQPNDVIYVPKTTISAIADVAEDIQRMIFFNGWGISLDIDPFAKDLVPVSTTVRSDSRSVTEEDATTGRTETWSSSSETRETEYDLKDER